VQGRLSRGPKGRGSRFFKTDYESVVASFDGHRESLLRIWLPGVCRKDC
jgi:hypothetical protein